jgi:tRNA threonylcarbamoyladenosine modification (KEOPS) complex  Pcc1 subunit
VKRVRLDLKEPDGVVLHSLHADDVADMESTFRGVLRFLRGDKRNCENYQQGED